MKREQFFYITIIIEAPFPGQMLAYPISQGSPGLGVSFYLPFAATWGEGDVL